MKITVSENRELDIRTITEFYEAGEPLIAESWPEIKESRVIPAVIEKEYGTELTAKVRELHHAGPFLNKTAKLISEVLKEDWKDNTTIAIYVGACPIAPRFLENNSMLLPYYYELPILINWATHEMIHFLYFQKWSHLFPEHLATEYESPHPIWVLSEILAIVIARDPRITSFVGTEFNLYPDWQNFKVNGKGLIDIFSPLYNPVNIDSTLKKSWAKYQELDKKFSITQKLTN